MAKITAQIQWASNTADLKAQIASGTGAIVAMKDAVDKTTRSLGGEGLFRAANNTTAAVMQLGGASKLTASEKERLNIQLTKAIEKYETLGQKAPPAMLELAEATRQTQSATELFQERWASFAAAAGAAVIGIKAAASALGELLSASSEAEDASVRLDTALRAQGMFTPQLSAQYADLAKQFQQTTVFSDDLIQSAQGLLVQIGNVMPGQMQGALEAATNLAAGLRIDLLTATNLVGKAFAGETGTLKRYGIVIDEATLKAGGATAVLQAINDKFGGQAQAQAETYTGKLALLGNQYNDVQERAGALLAQAIIPILEAFTSLSPATQTFISAAVILGGVLGPVALGFTGIFSAVSLLMPVLAAAMPAALTTLGALLGPGAVLIAGITAVVAIWKNWDTIGPIVQNVYVAVKTWLVDKFNAIVESIRSKVEAVTGFFRDMYDKVVGNSYVPDMVNQIGMHFGRLNDVMVAPTAQATTQTAGLFSQLKDVMSSNLAGLNGIFQAAFEGGGGMAGAVKSFATNVTANLLNLIPVVGPILSQFAGAFVAAGQKIGGFFKGLFGGPNGVEVEGRKAAAAFRDEIAAMNTPLQRAEAGTDDWKRSVIGVRDAFIAAGRTEQEALTIMDRLWRAEKQGGAAVAHVIREIQAVMNQVKNTTEATTGSVVAGFQNVRQSILVATDSAVDGFQDVAGAAVTAARVAASAFDATRRVISAPIVIPITPVMQPTVTSGTNGAGTQQIPSGASQEWADSFRAQNTQWNDDGAAVAWAQNMASQDGGGGMHDNLQRMGWDEDKIRQAGFAGGTGGQFLDFGAGTPTVLHGRERVMTEAEGRTESGSMARVANEIRAVMGEMRAYRRSVDEGIFRAIREGALYARAR